MSELSVQCICCGLKAISCTASLAPLHEGCKIAATLVAQKLLVTNHWFTSIYTISCMEYMLYGQGWRSLPHIIGECSIY